VVDPEVSDGAVDPEVSDGAVDVGVSVGAVDVGVVGGVGVGDDVPPVDEPGVGVGVGSGVGSGVGAGDPVLGGGDPGELLVLDDGGVDDAGGLGVEDVGGVLGGGFKFSHCCWLAPVTADTVYADTAAEEEELGVLGWSAEATKE